MSDVKKDTDLLKMQQIINVLSMLIPNGGYTLNGDSFSDINYIEAAPITQAQFDKGLADYAAWKSNQDAKAAADKASATAKLEALGLTADDLKALGL